MMYNYLKALHIIFVVTWFAGLFYVVRLFVYNREANDKPEPEKKILQDQFNVMIKRLWLGITWPSCLLTLLLGALLLSYHYPDLPSWLWVKLSFVLGLLIYHGSLHLLYCQQHNRIFRYSSLQLRIWNEVATLFLVAIVMLVVLKSGVHFIWGVSGFLGLALVLVVLIRIFKSIRN